MQLQATMGKEVKINDFGEMLVIPNVSISLKMINEVGGGVWTISFNTSTVAANKAFMYLKNTGEKDVHITGFQAASSVTANIISIYSATGVASSGDEPGIANMNLGYPDTLECDVLYGPNISGVTPGGLLADKRLDIAGYGYLNEIPSDIIIPKDKAVCISSLYAALVYATVMVSISE